MARSKPGKKVVSMGTRGTLRALEDYRRALYGLPLEGPVTGGYSIEHLPSPPSPSGDKDKSKL